MACALIGDKLQRELAALLDERFCRMWEFYLVTSEYSFRHLKHVVFQVQVTKALETLPTARDYMSEVERALPLALRYDASPL